MPLHSYTPLSLEKVFDSILTSQNMGTVEGGDVKTDVKFSPGQHTRGVRKRSFISTVTVHTNPPQERSFSKTSFKPE